MRLLSRIFGDLNNTKSITHKGVGFLLCVFFYLKFNRFFTSRSIIFINFASLTNGRNPFRVTSTFYKPFNI